MLQGGVKKATYNPCGLACVGVCFSACLQVGWAAKVGEQSPALSAMSCPRLQVLPDFEGRLVFNLREIKPFGPAQTEKTDDRIFDPKRFEP